MAADRFRPDAALIPLLPRDEVRVRGWDLASEPAVSVEVTARKCVGCGAPVLGVGYDCGECPL